MHEVMLRMPTSELYCHAQFAHYLQLFHDDDDDDDDVIDDVDDGYPAHSHHDKIPPWWENVSNDKGGNMSVTKSHHT